MSKLSRADLCLMPVVKHRNIVFTFCLMSGFRSGPLTAVSYTGGGFYQGGLAAASTASLRVAGIQSRFFSSRLKFKIRFAIVSIEVIFSFESSVVQVT